MRVFFPSFLPENLKRNLQKKAITCVEIPLIKTVPVDFNTNIDFSSFDYVIFSSKNGVKHFLSRVPPSKIAKCNVIAVGKSTAEKLKEVGIPSETPKKFSGEGLISFFSSKNVKGKKFLIVRPKIARKVLKEFLEENGADVKEIIVYETIINKEMKDELLKTLKEKIDVFVFTSPSTFKSFLKLSQSTGEKALKEGKIIPIGEVTAKAVEKKGYKVWKIPDEFTLNGIVNTIIKNLKLLEA
ncbi:uroporphyrinogen-III synthase [Desulfurobacterium atlanticum]|uniref:Uroporphyrinogen-III synthase n=1 Tax=Desulfurobacterium atlanticum TaxID=240169 RepID=A0A238XTV2_9BACT|nr:uroporphyrinogen-III synthase [Desulfurobacterium atlanticum]SNR61988.1 uroporphyrinogen-III synthase [Desulfurobacterium atlanticum]